MAKKSNLPTEVHDHFRKANVLHTYVEEHLGEAKKHALDIGQELSAAKKSLPHGRWEDECNRLFDGSARTARFYMEFARNMDALPKRQRTPLLMIEGSIEGAAKAAKAAANPKPAKPKPAPLPETLQPDYDAPDTAPIDVDSEAVEDTPVDYGKCPNCAGTKWKVDGADGSVDCSKCLHPHGEPVGDEVDAESVPEPEAAESAGTRLKDALLLEIVLWLEREDALRCLVGGILESLAATWQSELEN